MLAGIVAVLAVTAAGYGHATTAATNQVSVASSAPVLGVDVESDVDYRVAGAQAFGSRLAAYIHSTLHAQSVGIVWDFCDPSAASEIVGQCRQTLSVAAVEAIAREVRQDGMTVELRPLIRIGPPAEWGEPQYSWEGFINPPNQWEWMRRLLAAETPYLKFLHGFRGAQFVVASEPFAIAASPYWPWLLGKAHGICGCATSVASQISLYRAGVLPSRKAPGVDWYLHLNIPASASQRTVTAGWEASMNKLSPGLRARTTLDEEGIRATVGAYQHPESWNIGGPYDPQVQVRWITGACQTVARYHMRGVYFYEIPLNDDPAHPFNFPAFFVGNAGTKAIQGCAQLFSAARHRT